MAHRLYLYNIDVKTKEEYPHYLGEWNYEIPPLLIPLFSGNPRSKGKLMYFDKEEGVSRLRLFYQLLADHYQLGHQKGYEEPVNKMFEFLDDLPYHTLMINAWDVFNMNEDSHSDQAKEWIEEIKEQNQLYTKAIEDGNILILQEEILKRSGYSSFLEMLETDWIDYGLGYWNDDAYQDTTETFEENGLFGLKDHKGNCLLAPVYEEIFAFNDEGTAVAQKNGKFGYIKNDGSTHIECRYEDAFDAFSIEGKEYGIVKENGQFGIISISAGEWSVPNVYDEMDLLYSGLFNARKADGFRVIDLLNREVIADHSETPFDFDYHELIFKKQAGSSKRAYYTLKGTYLGEYPEDTLSPVTNGYYWVSPNKFQKKISIIKPDGSFLDTEIDTITVLGNYTSLAYRKDKKWRIYDLIHSCFRLEDRLLENVHIGWFTQFMKDIFVISGLGGTGLYEACNDRWLIPFSAENTKIEACSQEIFRIITQDGMLYYDQKTDATSDLYDCISEGMDYHDQLLCLFKNDRMFILDNNRLLHQVSDFQMGSLYEKKYNLRGKDQKYFLDFYRAWTDKMGGGYEVYFDDDTLKSRADQYIKEGTMKDAVRLYSLGAERGNADMQLELGFILTDQSNPEFYDLQKGISLYEKAAEKNQTYAWNNLGYHYQNGIGYPRNIKKALKCYQKSAELGNATALGNLGDLYFYGELLLKDYDKALEYYKQAEKKYSFNEENVSEIYFQKKDYSSLKRYLKKDRDQTYSLIYHGIMHDLGYGVKQDSKKAIVYYEKALEHNRYLYALERLLYYYKDDPSFADPSKYKQWIAYAKENDMDI